MASSVPGVPRSLDVLRRPVRSLSDPGGGGGGDATTSADLDDDQDLCLEFNDSDFRTDDDGVGGDQRRLGFRRSGNGGGGPYTPPEDLVTSFIDEHSAGGSEATGSWTSSGGGSRRRRGDVRGLVRRVSFDPISIVLNAALEGELDVVAATAEKVRQAYPRSVTGTCSSLLYLRSCRYR